MLKGPRCSGPLLPPAPETVSFPPAGLLPMNACTIQPALPVATQLKSSVPVSPGCDELITIGLDDMLVVLTQRLVAPADSVPPSRKGTEDFAVKLANATRSSLFRLFAVSV